MAGIGGYKKKTKGNRGYKMAGSPFPKKAGPEPKKFDVDNIDPFSDEETAYENAQNDYDTDNPTKAQLAKALAKVKAEKR